MPFSKRKKRRQPGKVFYVFPFFVTVEIIAWMSISSHKKKNKCKNVTLVMRSHIRQPWEFDIDWKLSYTRNWIHCRKKRPKVITLCCTIFFSLVFERVKRIKRELDASDIQVGVGRKQFLLFLPSPLPHFVKTQKRTP